MIVIKFCQNQHMSHLCTELDSNGTELDISDDTKLDFCSTEFWLWYRTGSYTFELMLSACY